VQAGAEPDAGPTTYTFVPAVTFLMPVAPEGLICAVKEEVGVMGDAGEELHVMVGTHFGAN